jgi:hypothetical protein
MKVLKILFYLVKNHFKNGQEAYRAAVQSRGTIDQAGLIRSMIYRGSSINEADILAVLRDYFDAIYEALLNGNSVTTPWSTCGSASGATSTTPRIPLTPTATRSSPWSTPGSS